MMSWFLFVLAIDWLMRKTTRRKRGIRWGLDTMEEQKKIELEVHAKITGLHINTAKTKVMKFKTDDNQPIVIGIDDVETVDSFTYLGSVMDAEKGSTADISAHLNKARAAYYKLRKKWASSQHRRKTNLREQCDVGSTIRGRMLEGKPK